MALSALVLVALALAFYMAWNIGANDLANSMADVVGSRALTLRQVFIVAAILNFLGATFFGSRVTSTVAGGIVPISEIDAHLVVLGCLGALFSAGLWVTLATFFRLPVSTSHSIVGAMLGFGLGCVAMGSLGLDQISWAVLIEVVISWILSPIAGMALAFVIYRLVARYIRWKGSEEKLERGIFRYLVIGSSCYQAFSFGSNDVANAIAPMSAILGNSEVPIAILAFGGLGIAIGLWTWGYRVVMTLGEKITELRPSRGFSADIACATTILVCSALGMPVSTTHTIVGSLVGVGLARGFDAVNFGTVKRIVYSWLATVPAAAAVSMAIFIGLVRSGI